MSYTTDYDNIILTDANQECRAWIAKLIKADDEIVAFVDARMNGGGRAKYKGFFKGAFNISYLIDFGGHRPDAVIRFAMPGDSVTLWREEKEANEVRFIEYLRENTTIPAPRIHCWGTAAECPRGLGPFIIMDYIEGIKLFKILEQPTEDEYEPSVLRSDVDEATLDTIYEQIADFSLQLAQLQFPRIGAISRKGGETGPWSVTGQPLTFNMNILGTTTGYPISQFPSTPLTSSRDFFHRAADQHLLHLETQRKHLETQRNLADDEADTQRRFVARHRIKQLIPDFCTDDNSNNSDPDPNPFSLFCDDLQPSNMLIDPSTLRITAVLDWEFTNAMPAQFAYDPPWWLLLKRPGLWIEEDGMASFLERYVPRLEQFLRAL